jgi:hypothetical protein
MRRINALVFLAALLLSTSISLAGPKTKDAKARKDGKPVTVTLVRWPYT